MSQQSSSLRFDGFAILLLGIVVLLGYANTLDGEFVYDDRGSIVLNSSVHWRELGLDPLLAAWRDSPTGRVVANWSFGLTYYFVREDVRVYHATNLFVHLAASLALFFVARRLLVGARGASAAAAAALPERVIGPAALAGALFFASHPLQTQAVAYVVQRMASLAGMFAVTSLLLYVRGRNAAGAGRARWWAGSVLCWLLAVGSKESAATFPAVIWAYEWLFHRRGDARWALRSAVWVAAAAVPMVALMFFNYPDPFRDYVMHDFSPAQRLLSQPRVLFYYAGLIALPLPSRLVLMHEFEPSMGLFTPPTTALALAALAGLVWAAWVGRRRFPLLVFGLLFFVIALAVESSIFPLRLVHEHRLYLPMAGVAIVFTRCVAELGARSPRATSILIPLLLVALLGATHVRNRVWHSRESLWSDVVAKSPSVPIGHLNLGAVYADAGDPDRARRLYEQATRLDPDYGAAYRALATAALEDGLYEEAIALLQKSTRLDPLDHQGFGQLGIALHLAGRSNESLRFFEHSLSMDRTDFVHNHYGKALLALGRVDEAAEQHRLALALNPDYAHAHLALGRSQAASGRLDEARRSFERSLAIEELAESHVEIANLEWSRGSPAAAQGRLWRALELDPESTVAANNLAWMLSTAAAPELRDGAAALRLLEGARARSSQPDPGLLDTVAAALAASGRFEEALQTAYTAQSQARELGDAELAASLNRRIEAYRAGRPWIDASSTPGERTTTPGAGAGGPR